MKLFIPLVVVLLVGCGDGVGSNDDAIAKQTKKQARIEKANETMKKTNTKESPVWGIDDLPRFSYSGL